MFFSKKKKNNASVRFQRRDFSRRVTAARGYKRQIRKAPESPVQAFLNKIGLGSKLTQLALAIILIALVYLTFVPNFLFIQDVKIEGVSPEAVVSVQTTVNDYMAASPGLWPQKNIVFLKRNSLSKYITDYNSTVLKVSSVKKRLWNKLVVSVDPRVEKFLVDTETNKYILYNDGVIARKLSGEDKTPEGLFRIKISTDDELNMGDMYLPGNAAENLREIFDLFLNSTGKVLDYVEIPVVAVKPKVQEAPTLQEGETQVFYEPVNDREELNVKQFVLFVKRDASAKDDRTNFRILIDPDSVTAAEMAARAKQMFIQLSPDRINTVYYIDLRFKDKAYVCPKNAACARTFTPVIIAPVPEELKPEATKPQN